jgi:hypothetical protein
MFISYVGVDGTGSNDEGEQKQKGCFGGGAHTLQSKSQIIQKHILEKKQSLV